MKYRVVQNGVTADMYCQLRLMVDFQKYDERDVELALKNTLFSVAVFDKERPIGIARVVGDGVIVFFIKDVVVDPEYHRKSIGKILMGSLFTYIDSVACANAYVGLMATPGTEEFYEKFDFVRRPNQIQGAGMVKFVKTGLI